MNAATHHRIDGYPETDVTATLVYKSQRTGNDVEVALHVTDITTRRNHGSCVVEIDGVDESAGRQLHINTDAFPPVETVQSISEKRTVNLGTLERIEFPREAIRHHAYVTAGADFYAPPDSTPDEIEEMAEAAATRGNLTYHDLNSTTNDANEPEVRR